MYSKASAERTLSSKVVALFESEIILLIFGLPKIVNPQLPKIVFSFFSK